ncbi:MAG: DegT/DnrJ/EryC1/StrS family aminotransferase [Candidatus Omnitrophica bacterium]|nr:DegT/DnrJ/EryC1/StrS family aminotransferase [Candidatus Omnitrophota bacterium]
MKVSFLDLRTQYKSIKKELQKAFDDIFENQQFILGPYVEKFEKEFAAYCQAKYCIGVNSGTTALFLALNAYNIKAGDEVILPVNTFIATAEAVSMCNATPVFIDIKEDDFNIDVKKIEKAITKRTKAIIPVHLYGQCADIDAVKKIAKKYKLLVVEDACQAHGAEYKGRRAGSLAEIAAFSFYPGKNLGAYGEAGAVTTNNEKIAKKIMVLRNHGAEEKYYHDLIGGNYRMEGLQGAVLLTKLKYLEKNTNLRRNNAASYSRLLKENKNILTPVEQKDNRHVYHLYVVRVPQRDKIIEQLKTAGIFTGIHYPVPLHLQKAYKHLGYKKGDFPVAESAALQILSLPMYSELKKKEIEYVAQKLNALVKI